MKALLWLVALAALLLVTLSQIPTNVPINYISVSPGQVYNNTANITGANQYSYPIEQAGNPRTTGVFVTLTGATLINYFSFVLINNTHPNGVFGDRISGFIDLCTAATSINTTCKTVFQSGTYHSPTQTPAPANILTLYTDAFTLQINAGNLQLNPGNYVFGLTNTPFVSNDSLEQINLIEFENSANNIALPVANETAFDNADNNVNVTFGAKQYTPVFILSTLALSTSGSLPVSNSFSAQPSSAASTVIPPPASTACVLLEKSTSLEKHDLLSSVCSQLDGTSTFEKRSFCCSNITGRAFSFSFRTARQECPLASNSFIPPSVSQSFVAPSVSTSPIVPSTAPSLVVPSISISAVVDDVKPKKGIGRNKNDVDLRGTHANEISICKQLNGTLSYTELKRRIQGETRGCEVVCSGTS